MTSRGFERFSFGPKKVTSVNFSRGPVKVAKTRTSFFLNRDVCNFIDPANKSADNHSSILITNSCSVIRRLAIRTGGAVAS